MRPILYALFFGCVIGASHFLGAGWKIGVGASLALAAGSIAVAIVAPKKTEE